MTTQQTDIEKTLKRILARELKEWPADALGKPLNQAYDGSLYVSSVHLNGCRAKYFNVYVTKCPYVASEVSRAEWEAERALLDSEQAQPLGDSEEFDQALWDKVASEIFTRACDESIASYRPEEVEYVAVRACTYADAFMDERAKRIAARKASHD